MSSENQPAPPLRVLVVEDDVANQKVALRFLERLGHRADVARNGREALATLEQRPYDVVFMDLEMPEMDGLEATRRIRVQWPQGGLRIIALTANTAPEDREACAAVGMDGFVSKPVALERLKDALEAPAPGLPVPGANAASHPSPSFDPEQLSKLGQLGDPTLVPELISLYLSEATNRLAALRTAVRDGNAGQIQIAVHSLRGSSAALGLAGVVASCRTLEDEARAGRLEHALARSKAIEVEIDRAREWLAGFARR